MHFPSSILRKLLRAHTNGFVKFSLNHMAAYSFGFGWMLRPRFSPKCVDANGISIVRQICSFGGCDRQNVDMQLELIRIECDTEQQPNVADWKCSACTHHHHHNFSSLSVVALEFLDACVRLSLSLGHRTTQHLNTMTMAQHKTADWRSIVMYRAQHKTLRQTQKPEWPTIKWNETKWCQWLVTVQPIET